jgi:hypothetical protein
MRILPLTIKNAGRQVVLDKERCPLLNAVAPVHFLRTARAGFGIINGSRKGRNGARAISVHLVQGEFFHGGV